MSSSDGLTFALQCKDLFQRHNFFWRSLGRIAQTESAKAIVATSYTADEAKAKVHLRTSGAVSISNCGTNILVHIHLHNGAQSPLDQA
jgi:hypothetical protein